MLSAERRGYSIVLGCIVLIGFSKELIDIGRYGFLHHTSLLVKVSGVLMGLCVYVAIHTSVMTTIECYIHSH